jgi:hypothetical protein
MAFSVMTFIPSFILILFNVALSSSEYVDCSVEVNNK